MGFLVLVAPLLIVLFNFNVVLRVIIQVFVKEILCGAVVVAGRFEIRGSQDGFRLVCESRCHHCCLEIAFSSETLKSQLVSGRIRNCALVFGQMLGRSQNHYVLRLVIKCIEVRQY